MSDWVVGFFSPLGFTVFGFFTTASAIVMSIALKLDIVGGFWELSSLKSVSCGQLLANFEFGIAVTHLSRAGYKFISLTLSQQTSCHRSLAIQSLTSD